MRPSVGAMAPTSPEELGTVLLLFLLANIAAVASAVMRGPLTEADFLPFQFQGQCFKARQSHIYLIFSLIF